MEERFYPQDEDEDFSLMNRVEKALTERGFTIGQMQRGDPRGIMKGVDHIAKWRNLSKQDRDELDGVMTFVDGSPRRCTAIVITWTVQP